MRNKIIAGNWKMNTSLPNGLKLAASLINSIPHDVHNSWKVILAVPFTHLSEVVKISLTSKIEVAAQNCHHHPEGAYTGEVSAEMIGSTGAKYIIIGHSERRNYFAESNELLAEKVNIAIKNMLSPIYCCGEKLQERVQEQHFEIVKNQIEHGLFHLAEKDFCKVIVAYEPVWAIGTGKTATPEQAQEMHCYIRKLIEGNYGAEIAEQTSLLYGGSCNPSNAAGLFINKDIDGGLIGGASLKPEDFVAIINCLAKKQ